MEKQISDYDETKRVLDLDKLHEEKKKIIALIRPAIEQFVISTGVVPSIHVTKVVSSIETKCGNLLSEGEVSISVSINI